MIIKRKENRLINEITLMFDCIYLLVVVLTFKLLSTLQIKTIVKVLEIFFLTGRVWYLGRIKFAQTKLVEAA